MHRIFWSRKETLKIGRRLKTGFGAQALQRLSNARFRLHSLSITNASDAPTTNHISILSPQPAKTVQTNTNTIHLQESALSTNRKSRLILLPIQARMDY